MAILCAWAIGGTRTFLEGISQYILLYVDIMKKAIHYIMISNAKKVTLFLKKN